MVVAHYDGENLLLDGEVVPDKSTRRTITSVTFPEGLRSIGDDAFLDCQLTSVTFPAGLQSIGNNAFYHCPLTSVTFSAGLQSIGDNAFADCPLTSVTFPEDLQSIGYGAFYHCPLTSVTFPEGLQCIGDYAFAYCSLTTVTFSAGFLSYVGYSAFANCPFLTSVLLPDPDTYFHRDVFKGCTALEASCLASGYVSVMPYLRFQVTVRLRVATLLSLKRLRDEYNAGNYEAVETAGTTPAVGTLEGRLAFQMITSDDLWRYILEFLGPEEEEQEEEDDEEEFRDYRSDDYNAEMNGLNYYAELNGLQQFDDEQEQLEEHDEHEDEEQEQWEEDD